MLSDFPVGGVRRGQVRISNLLDKPQVIAINAGLNPSKLSTDLKFPGKVELEPNGTADVSFEIPGDNIQGIEETLTLSTALYSRELSISARATPGRLVLEDHTSGVPWNFGKVEVETEASPKEFTFKNHGGSPVVATVSSEPPFVV